MPHKVFKFDKTDRAVIEKIVDTKDVSIAHAVIEPGESFPKHAANANVMIILVKGVITAVFDENPECVFTTGSVISVPLGTEMELKNEGDGNAEFFAVKAPSPTFKK